MGYPKYKFSKKEIVLVKTAEQEKELGKEFFESPVEAESEFEYEGKVAKPSKTKDHKGDPK